MRRRENGELETAACSADLIKARDSSASTEQSSPRLASTRTRVYGRRRRTQRDESAFARLARVQRTRRRYDCRFPCSGGGLAWEESERRLPV